MQERRWFALASTSSERIVKICGDQPRMTVWPCSMTRERPLRSSSELRLDAARQDADQDGDDEDAAQRDREHRQQETERPVSPPIVPGSSVRSRFAQSA